MRETVDDDHLDATNWEREICDESTVEFSITVKKFHVSNHHQRGGVLNQNAIPLVVVTSEFLMSHIQ